MRNFQEQVKKALYYQKLFWPFTVWINCSSNLKNFANSWPSALKFKSFSRSLEQFFLTVGQNNFGKKIPFAVTHKKVTAFKPISILKVKPRPSAFLQLYDVLQSNAVDKRPVLEFMNRISASSFRPWIVSSLEQFPHFYVLWHRAKFKKE